MNKYNKDSTIKLDNGKEICRKDVAFVLAQSDKHKDILRTVDGIVYLKTKKDGIRRISPGRTGQGKAKRLAKRRALEEKAKAEVVNAG